MKPVKPTSAKVAVEFLRSLEGTIFSDAADHIEAREATIAELVEALEPFAELACEGNEDQPDDTPCEMKIGRVTHYRITLGDCRRIRAALSRARGKEAE